MVTFTPFTVTLVVFHELMAVVIDASCQQNVPAPSCVKGAVIATAGLHGGGKQPQVGVAVGVMVIVGVRVGVLVTAFP